VGAKTDMWAQKVTALERLGVRRSTRFWVIFFEPNLIQKKWRFERK
jgi:hypothetical protein